jgi:hypothetical protein
LENFICSGQNAAAGYRRALDKKAKLKHWRAHRGKNGLEAAPVLEFYVHLVTTPAHV